MLPVQRQMETVGLLSTHGAVAVEDLAERLGVSLSTVRRDLDDLERQGVVRRVHGGAVLTDPPALADEPEAPIRLREVERSHEKQAIALRAIELVEPGSVLLLTGGTTTAALAPLLASVPGIRVVTNSLDVAIRLANVDLDLTVLGGSLRRPELSLLGPLVGLGLDDLHIDHVIMGAYGIDQRSGVLGASAPECEVDRRLAGAAERLTLLVDSTKFTHRSPHRIVGLEAISELVTSTMAPIDELDGLRARGLRILTT